jgi:type III secretion protein U
MAGESEEKNLPASHRKLRKAREKGEVPSSADFVALLGFAAGLTYLLMNASSAVAITGSAFRLALDRMQAGRSDLLSTIVGLTWLIGDFVVPLMVAVAAGGFAGHLIHKKGLVFSMHPIVPDFSRINPAQGFERIFSMRNGVEFLVSLARVTIWLIASSLIIWFAFPDVLRILPCGYPCLTEVGWSLGMRLMVVGILLLILFSLLDLPLQIFLFLRDQRMSRSEMKREMKEQEGSPEITSSRREIHRQMATSAGVRGATLIVMSSNEVVAIQYDPVSQPVPIILAKGAGRTADPILKAAELLATPIEIDPRLARELSRVGIGSIVPQREFGAVAAALVKFGKAG